MQALLVQWCWEKTVQEINNKRNKTIDAIKGLLILFVIFGHINISIETRRILLAPFWENSAVPMFMLVSGYLYANSFKKNSINNLSCAFNYKSIIKKLLRFFIPYSIFFIFEILLYVLINSEFVSQFIANTFSMQFSIDNYVPEINNIVLMFIKGGEGPGNYYVPLMIEFIFIFPFLYFLVKKEKKKGILICGLITTAYNLAYTYFNIDLGDSFGNLICSLFVISVGIYASLYNIDLKNTKIYISACIGFVYILLVKYFDYNPVVFNCMSSRALPACLFWCPIVLYLINKNSLNNRFLSYIGSISFDILLVQKVFFLFFNIVVYYFVDNLFVQICIIFIVVIILGIIFSNIEKEITKIIFKKKEE